MENENKANIYSSRKYKYPRVVTGTNISTVTVDLQSVLENVIKKYLPNKLSFFEKEYDTVMGYKYYIEHYHSTSSREEIYKEYITEEEYLLGLSLMESLNYLLKLKVVLENAKD